MHKNPKKPCSKVEEKQDVLQKLESLKPHSDEEEKKSDNVPQLVREQVGGKVLPFGSFAMGQNMKDADIDLLCVGPRFIPREIFFSSFVEKLRTTACSSQTCS
uniref:Poly(A) polymerase nucleotidyltransferase domain-containing protein n=1 Tax=Knipowitschia caucasica TaxID=637954 RepID=A0AAV2MAQ7_KNICA